MEWFAALKSDYTMIVLGRLLLASFLGGLIGLEREAHGRPAGFRTHLLVALGACLMMIVSEFFSLKYGQQSSDLVIRLDPSRVAAQIVVGIGFLGAGAIIKEGRAVRGLTTAACLWVVAGLGMAVGIGLYVPALMVTVVALLSLLVLKHVERLLQKDQYRVLFVETTDMKDFREKLGDLLRERRIEIVEFAVEKDLSDGVARYTLTLSKCGRCDRDALLDDVVGLNGVNRVRIN
ncbi:MAG TPA: MgtC/SapB family protein [Desulfuromonadales bacterium]|nr:MgtC/SapB family protein [Desulfuromonadales bacterium]